MPDAAIASLVVDLKIRLSLIRQRRGWIFRDLALKDGLKSDAAQKALIDELMKIFAHYEVREIEREVEWPSTSFDLHTRGAREKKTAACDIGLTAVG